MYKSLCSLGQLFWSSLEKLESNSAIACGDSYASLVFRNFSSASITQQKHADRVCIYVFTRS